MVVVVNDTSVLIDLADMGLIEVLPALNWELQTSDLIIEELAGDAGFQQIEKLIAAGHLHVASFVSDDMSVVAEMSGEYGSLSIEDCSVWYMAKERDAILLTADRQLRKIAQSDGIEVHGTLYVVEQFVLEGTITANRAIQALSTLKASNQRAPTSEINRMIDHFKSRG